MVDSSPMEGRELYSRVRNPKMLGKSVKENMLGEEGKRESNVFLNNSGKHADSICLWALSFFSRAGVLRIKSTALLKNFLFCHLFSMAQGSFISPGVALSQRN